MPYVFDQIDNSLDGNGQNQNQNIFATQNNTAQQNGQQPATSGSDTVQKGSTEGQIDASGANSSTSPKSPSTESPEDRQKVINLQAQRQGAPKATQEVADNLTQAKQNLQNEANTYVQGYQNADYREGVDSDTLNKAVQGDQDAYSKAAQRLQEQAYNVTDFTPQTQYQNLGAEDFQSKAGIKNYFLKEGDPQYRASDAAFDTMLLGRNPEFQKIQQALMQQQSDLTKFGQDTTQSSNDQAKQLADTGFTTATNAIRGDLGGYSDNIVNALKAQAAQEQARRAAIDPMTAAQENEQRIINQIKNEYANSANTLQKRSLDMLGQGLDPTQYVTVNKDVDYRDFANADQAAQFNRVMNLLGQGDYLTPGNGPKAAVSVNEGGLRNALISQALAARTAQENKERAERDAILASAQAQAQGANQSRAMGADFYANPIVDQLRSQYGGDLDAVLGGVDRNSYYTAGSKLNPISLLDPTALSRLNLLSSDIGEDPYAAAQVGGADQFRADEYRNALSQAVNNYRADQAAAQQRADDREDARTPYFDIPTRYGNIPGPTPNDFNGIKGILGGSSKDKSSDPVSQASDATVICTELVRQGELPVKYIKAGSEFREQYLPLASYRNYRAWADPLVEVMQKSKLISKLVSFFLTPMIYQMAYRTGKIDKAPFLGRLSEMIILPLSNFVGKNIRRMKKKAALKRGVNYV